MGETVSAEFRTLVEWAITKGARRVRMGDLEVELDPPSRQPEREAKPSPEEERKRLIALRYHSGVLPPEVE